MSGTDPAIPVTRVACIGEAMIELSMTGGSSADIGYAGDTLNTAIYLKRATGPSAAVSYVTVLGADPFSLRMRGIIEAEGIDTHYIGTSADRLPGIYAISISGGGERSFHYWRENSAARTLFQPGSGTTFEMLDDFDVVYFSGITLAILPPQTRADLLDFLTSWRRHAGRRVAFDSNYRPRLWANVDDAREWIGRAWKIADIALPSIDDELALFGDTGEAAVISRIGSAAHGIGALKRGALGPLPIGAAVEQVEYPAVSKVVDTTAAGDSFNGGFIGALLRGKTIAGAMADGHAFAATVIGHRGAIIPAAEMPVIEP